MQIFGRLVSVLLRKAMPANDIQVASAERMVGAFASLSPNARAAAEMFPQYTKTGRATVPGPLTLEDGILWGPPDRWGHRMGYPVGSVQAAVDLDKTSAPNPRGAVESSAPATPRAGAEHQPGCDGRCARDECVCPVRADFPAARPGMTTHAQETAGVAPRHPVAGAPAPATGTPKHRKK